MPVRAVFWMMLMVAGLSGCDGKDPAPPLFPDAGVRCLGASDMALIESLRADAGPDAGPFEPALMSAMVCGGDPTCLDPLLNGNVDAGYPCVSNCMSATPAGGLSEDCKYCYIVNGLFCAGAYCLTQCLGNDVTVCDTCFSQNCRAGFEHCVGF